MDILLYGSKGEKIKMVRDTDDVKSTYYTEFEGVANNLERRFRETSSNWMREEITTWMNSVNCPEVPRRPSEKGKPVGADRRGSISVSFAGFRLPRCSTFLTSWS